MSRKYNSSITRLQILTISDARVGGYEAFAFIRRCQTYHAATVTPELQAAMTIYIQKFAAIMILPPAKAKKFIPNIVFMVLAFTGLNR